MTAGDVAEFVRQHALHLGGGVGFLDQPAVKVDDLPARDESVDRRRVEQRDVDAALRHVGGFH